MLAVYINGTDYTASVRRDSITITEQMNNRSNTCSFIVDQEIVPDTALIEVRDGFELLEQASSGQNEIVVKEAFEYREKVREGDVLFLGIGTADRKKVVVDSINYETKTITLVDDLLITYPIGTKFGIMKFTGVSMKIPAEEIGVTATFQYTVNAVDRTKVFDAKLVVETYANMYAKEIFSRIVYRFTAVDAFLVLADLNDGGSGTAVASGVGNGLAYNSDAVVGSHSIAFGSSGAGTATVTVTLDDPTDISEMNNLRSRFKMKSGQGEKISSGIVRAYDSLNNYFERDMLHVGEPNEDCRHYEAFDLINPDRYSSTLPDLTDITKIAFSFVVTEAVSADGIRLDNITATLGGFTLKKTIRGDQKFEDVRVSYKKPTVVFEDLTKLENLFRKVDYEKDIHTFASDATPAPFSLTDTSKNYGKLRTTADRTQLKNRQTVRGGMAADDNDYTQVTVSDGEQDSYSIDYGPKDLRVYIDETGVGDAYVGPVAIGVENLVDETTVDYVWSFTEKLIRKTSATATLPAGSLFKMIYKPYKPIRVRVQNVDSIARTKALLGGDGVFDGAVINDTSIRDRETARQRGRAEMEVYSNPIITCSFETEQDGLKAGQIIHITDSSEGRQIDDDFLIQKVNIRSKNNEIRTYQVEAGSSMFGLTEFLQMLLKRTDNLSVDVSEQVDILLNIDEVISLEEDYEIEVKARFFETNSLEDRRYDFVANVGGANTQGRVNPDRYFEKDGDAFMIFGTAFEDAQRIVFCKDRKVVEMIENETSFGDRVTNYTEDRFGNKNAAIDFIGLGHHAFEYGAASAPTAATIFLKIKPNESSTANSMILSYFGIAVSVNQDEIKVRYNASETEQTYARANADFENIAITISNSTQKQRIYINGTFVDELDMEANIGTAKTDSTYWYLGQYSDGDPDFFTGVLEQCQIYHSVLSDRKIRERGFGHSNKTAMTICSNIDTGGSDFGGALTTCFPVSEDTEYDLSVWTNIVETMSVATGGGIIVRAVALDFRKIGPQTDRASVELDHVDLVSEVYEKHDRKVHKATRTTPADTTHIFLIVQSYFAEGSFNIADFRMIEQGTEVATIPSRVDYAVTVNPYSGSDRILYTGVWEDTGHRVDEEPRNDS